MEQLKHFSHKHFLSLVQLQLQQPDRNNEYSDKEDEDEDEGKNDFVVEELPREVGECEMCKEEIYSFHLCYYSCKTCDYSLHKFCAQLPEFQQNHPLHPGHNLTLSKYNVNPDRNWICDICKTYQNRFYYYNCSICNFDIDIVCATMSEQKMDHPSHPHQLQRYFGRMISRCNACHNEHSGTFYHCATCSWFRIHLECALLPPKLLIQQSTDGSFSHSHLLTLAYSYPYVEIKDNFFPPCRVCDKHLYSLIWHYRCDKCRYYAHVDCATSIKEAFTSSILMPAGMGKIYKNFKDEDHPNLIRYPFPDESVNLVMQQLINKGKIVVKEKIVGEKFSHPHPLILVDTLLNGSVSLHDPMKRVELLCDGCVRPIMALPFYKCSQHNCGFVLHEWCTRLPSEIHDHHDHPEHPLVLMQKAPKRFLSVFHCRICFLPCNGFVYGCRQCSYYVDVNCGFIPNVITHEAHPDHLLLRWEASATRKCKACRFYLRNGFHCPTCDFWLHTQCALLLPGTIRHKYDKHPLSLRYHPAENHSSKYFCEICEDELNPEWWFYHCSMCALSMHTACAPLKLECEQSTYNYDEVPIFWYLNVKFGGTHEIPNHPHPLTFVQGINDDGKCMVCHDQLQYAMILKCFLCKFALHYLCEKKLIKGSTSEGSTSEGSTSE